MLNSIFEIGEIKVNSRVKHSHYWECLTLLLEENQKSEIGLDKADKKKLKN